MRQTTTTIDLTTAQAAYLTNWLDKVSRSFALVVPWLEAPLNHYLATAYLLCRVVDNIEDCSQPADWKQRRFGEAARLLAEPDQAGEILAGWQQASWPGLTSAERQLMGRAGGERLWQIYASLPIESRQIIQHWILDMIDGMSQLEAPDRAPYFVAREDVQVLAGAGDYNQYCYIVAGTVGYLSTELAIQHYGFSNSLAERLLADCLACGHGLQKTNIVKDFATDLRRGVSYLPDQWLQEVDFAPLSLQGASPAWSQTVLADILAELRDATNYVLTLPYEAIGYRLASLMCLLPAYQTILLAAQQQANLFTTAHQVKISRSTMMQCIQDAQAVVTDNAAVLAYSHRLEQAVRLPSSGRDDAPVSPAAETQSSDSEVISRE
jgi:farnesyl-diphosphate farnesyltransferase